jgi:hypothetical protein
MTKGLFGLMLVGTLAVALSGAAQGIDRTVGLGTTRDTLSLSQTPALPLPPIPELETMPWMATSTVPKGPKIDTLLQHKPDGFGSPTPPSFANMPLWPNVKTFEQATSQ